MSRSLITRKYPSLVSALASLGLVIAPIGIPSQAGAQTLEEVVVTAQKREESLQDAPISLAVFGANDLENLGASKAGDVGEYVPNVSIRQQPSSQDNYGLAIRGIASGETSTIVEPTVGVYIDGIYFGSTVGAAFDVNDIERIEVLRGPQGTLYGRNTIGGALNVVTRRPSGEFSFEQRLTGGARGNVVSRTSFDSANADLGFGELAISGAYYLQERDGLVTNLADNSELGNFESQAFRFAAKLTVDAVVLDYTYNNSERETNPGYDQFSHVRASHSGVGGPLYKWAATQANQDRVGAVRKHFTDGDNPPQTSDIESHDLVVSFDTPYGEFKSITGYREWDSGGINTSDFGSILVDGADMANVLTPTPFGTLAPLSESRAVSLFQASRTSDLEQLSQEFQLVGVALGDRLEYAVGLFYFDSEVNEVNPQEFTLAGPYGAAAVANGIIDADPRLDRSMSAAVADLLCAGAYDPRTASIAGAQVANGLGARCFGKDVVLSNPLQYGQEQESKAIYGQFTYQYSDELRITVGGRYTEDDKNAYLFQRLSGAARGTGDYNLRTTPYAAGDKSLYDKVDGTGSHARVPAGDSWSKFTYNVNLNWQWDDQLSTYAGVATGYRSGGFNARASNERSWTVPYDEETVISYEFGWKWQSELNNLRVNGAIFLNDYEDRQLAQFEAGSGGASSFITNAGEQENLGLEIDVAWAVTEELTLMFGYGYLDSEFKFFEGSKVSPINGFPSERGMDGDPIVRDLSDDAGVVVPFAPENTASLQLEYQYGSTGFGDLSFWLGASYSSDISYHAQLNTFDTTDSYALIDARITLADIPLGEAAGSLRLSLWGKNIADEEVREWGIDFGALGFAVNTYKELASWGLDLVYNY